MGLTKQKVEIFAPLRIAKNMGPVNSTATALSHETAVCCRIHKYIQNFEIYSIQHRENLEIYSTQHTALPLYAV